MSAQPSPFRNRILRPHSARATRILFIAEYAPDEFAPIAKTFPGDGGYPAYHHAIWEVLTDIGYSVRSSSSPTAALFSGKDIDFVFSLYNRMPVNNSEVMVSAFCEYARVPYLGAPSNIRALAEDKWLTKLAARSIGIPTPEGIPYRDHGALGQSPNFPGPYFVKNRFGAASEGIGPASLQDTWEGAKIVALDLIEQGMSVLVERYAPGIDVTVPILGSAPPMVLGHVHPRSNAVGQILTEDLKMDDPLGYEMYDIGPVSKVVLEDAHRLWAAAGPMDYLRMDYRFDPTTGERAFLEFNVCCFLGESGAICLAGSEHGLSQADIVAHVVEFGLRRQSGDRQHLQWVL